MQITADLYGPRKAGPLGKVRFGRSAPRNQTIPFRPEQDVFRSASFLANFRFSFLSRNLSDCRPQPLLNRRQHQCHDSGIISEHRGLGQCQPTVDHQHYLSTDDRERNGPGRRVPGLPALDGLGFAGYVWALSAAVASAVPAPVAVPGAAAPVPVRAAPQPSPSAAKRSRGA